MTGNQDDMTDGDTKRESYLSVLSQAQYDAVTASPDEPLQILAGPGSGKTRVLVSRVAWLILEKGINPRDLVVVTFTNKAANEMKERLTKLIGKERTANLILGTFHATCSRYLRSHAMKVGIKNNFTVYDSDDQAKYFKKLMKENEFVKDEINKMSKGDKVTAGLIGAEISKAKAKNVTAKEYKQFIEEVERKAELEKKYTNKAIHKLINTIYALYERHLRETNCLDFDDLLMFGLKLVSEHGKVTANLRHVLVDEFQDTNTIQYQLMYHMAGRSGSRGSVSIVGDPDQSIYGWRSAEVGNLEKMAEEFSIWTESEEIKRVFLEENYRSTGKILEVAKAVIEGSSSRIDRGLFTSHQAGPKVVLKKLEEEVQEASFIATEIKRLIACSGGLYTFDDFAILLRFNALSRNPEQQLMHENIPCRILGGLRFFERKEVKDLLAYLTLAENTEFEPALDRIINVPRRKIGDTTVNTLKQVAKDHNLSAMELIEQIVAGKKFEEIKTLPKKQLENFVEIIHEIRRMGQEHKSVDLILLKVIELTKFEEHLKKETDFNSRWENVKELITFATQVMRGIGIVSDLPDLPNKGDEEDEEDSQDNYLSSLVSQINKRSAKKLPENAVPPSSLTSQIHSTASQATSVTPSKKNAKSGKGKKAVSKKRKDKDESDVIDLLSSSDEEEEESTRSAKNADRTKPEAVDEDDDELEEAKRTPLQIFIESCTLSTDVQVSDEDEKNGKKPAKVTIATSHAAKGLEFPVVFVISVENDTYPFYRSKNSQEEIDEETRLLYVAITRAQTLCYLCHVDSRTVYGDSMPRDLSPFISRITDIKQGGHWKEAKGETVEMYGGYIDGPSAPVNNTKKSVEKVDFGTDRPKLSMQDIGTFCAILNRPIPPEDRVKKLTSAFENSEYWKKMKKLNSKESSRSKPSSYKQDDSGYSEYRNQRPSGFGNNDNFTPFSSNTFSSNNNNAFASSSFGQGQMSSGFTSASSLLASLGGGKPLKTTDQNANFSGFSTGNGKRLGVGRTPLHPSMAKKSKKE